LIRRALGATTLSQFGPAAQLSVERGIALQERFALHSSQLDIANPEADGRLRDADPLRDLVDRRAFASTNFPSEFAFLVFSLRKTYANDRTNKRAIGVEPT
jgi:hypothetical protein